MLTTLFLVVALPSTALGGDPLAVFASDPLRLGSKHPLGGREPVQAVAGEVGGMQADWDVDQYTITTTLKPDEHKIIGHIRVRAIARVDSPGPFLLHATDPAIESVSAAGMEISWQREKESVVISPGEVLTKGESLVVSVGYHAPGNKPGEVERGLNWGEPIFSFHEPKGARKWLVVYDDPADKATLEWQVTAPDDLVVWTNGSVVSQTDNGDGTKTWVRRFNQPIATYLMVLDAGAYLTEVDETGPVPVFTVATEAQMSTARADLANTGEMITHFSGLWEDYPWTHYANIMTPLGGAMEHTTATSFGSGLLGSDYAEIVNVHEVAHHWWGDWVTCEEWAEIWLNEGFATYAETLWVFENWGWETGLLYLRNQRDTYFAWHEYEGIFALHDPNYMWGGTVYEKGALVLHMLRRVLEGGDLADGAFDEVLALYGETHAHGTATTPDLQAAAEAVHGEGLAWFFDQWVYRAGDPSYVVGMTQTALAEGGWQVDVHVAQDGEQTWRMPLDWVLSLADGSLAEGEVWADGAASVASFCLGVRALELEVDPDGHSLWESLERHDSRFVAAPLICGEGTVGEPAADSGAPAPDTGLLGLGPGVGLSTCACSSTGTRGSWAWFLPLLLIGVRRKDNGAHAAAPRLYRTAG